MFYPVRGNNDTIYSLATVNAREGFTLMVPEVRERFLDAGIAESGVGGELMLDSVRSAFNQIGPIA